MNLKELFHHETNLIQIGKGQPIFSKNDWGDVMYVLMEGSADITIGNYVVEKAEPGAILGEMALVEHAPRTATVIATSDCKLLPINLDRYHFLVSQTPNFATHIMKIMTERLRKMNLRLIEAQG